MTIQDGIFLGICWISPNHLKLDKIKSWTVLKSICLDPGKCLLPEVNLSRFSEDLKMANEDAKTANHDQDWKRWPINPAGRFAAAVSKPQDFKEPNKIKELTGWGRVTFVVGNYSEFWGYKKFPKQSLFRTITVENLEQILTAWFSFPDFQPFAFQD